jgi:hypothetical protein
MKTHFCRKPDESIFLHGLKITGLVILGVIAFTAFAFLLGILIVYLWNWLMPALFGIKTITFWQAIGILVLARIIFGGLHAGGHHHKHPEKQHGFFRPSRYHMHKAPFSKWSYYDDYWEEEGEKAYDAYVKRKSGTQDQPAT